MDNKEIIKSNFECGSTPSANDFATMIDSCVGVLTDIAQLPPADSTLVNTCYKIGNNIYTCQLDEETYKWVSVGIGGGAESDYLNLTNKPTIGGVILSGNKTLGQLGAVAVSGNSPATAEDSDVFYVNRVGSVRVVPYTDFKNVQSDWSEEDINNPAYIKNKPIIPIVPPLSNATITIMQQGGDTQSFTLNQHEDTTIQLPSLSCDDGILNVIDTQDRQIFIYPPDAELDEDSEHAIQNAVVTTALQEKANVSDTYGSLLDSAAMEVDFSNINVQDTMLLLYDSSNDSYHKINLSDFKIALLSL